MSTADDEWERTEATLAALSVNDQQGEAGSTPQASSENAGEEQIDPALLSAMDNPRERMALFQIEDNLLKFVMSSDRMMEIPPGLNSFRRLLAHRIGQRFGLGRTQSENSNEYGDRGIILYKTPSTAVPKVLLIDYAKSSSVSPTAETVGTGPSKEPAKKIMVMKRRTDGVNANSGKFSSTKKEVSAEERGRAYQEARARIFGDDSAAGTPSAPSSPAPEADAAPPASQATSSANGASSLVGPCASSEPLTPDDSAQEEEGSLRKGGSGKQRVVDVGSWKEKKVQLRNSEAEKSDPDFSRRAIPIPAPAPPVESTTYGCYYQDEFPQLRGNNIPRPPSLLTPTHYGDGRYNQAIWANKPSQMQPEYYEPGWSNMATLDPRYRGQPAANYNSYIIYPVPGMVGQPRGQMPPQQHYLSKADFPPL